MMNDDVTSDAGQETDCSSSHRGQVGWGRTTGGLRITLLVCLIVSGLIAPASGRRPHLRYMSNHCSETLGVYSSLLLALIPSDVLPEARDSARKHSVHCKVVLRAPPRARILLHFLQLGISPDRLHHDRVTVYDKNVIPREVTPRGGLFGQLDRDLAIADSAGSKVQDYKSTGNEMTVEYVGVPTVKHPGFRILVTVFRNPHSDGHCPREHFKCPAHADVCVPAASACDGYANCGRFDPGDERNCDDFDMVTDLLDRYSLIYDILVMSMLPLLVFILVTIAAFCFLRRYIRLKITIQTEPSVQYTVSRGGRARLKRQDDEAAARLYAPPSYEDVVKPSKMAPPPDYSSLAGLVKKGEVEVVDSEDEMGRMSPRESRRRRGRWEQQQQQRYRSQHHRSGREDVAHYTSASSIGGSSDAAPSPKRERARIHSGHSPKPYKGLYEVQKRGTAGTGTQQGGAALLNSDDTDEEEERVKRNRRKGGRAKKTVCVKRRADDLVSGIADTTGANSGVQLDAAEEVHRSPICGTPSANLNENEEAKTPAAVTSSQDAPSSPSYNSLPGASSGRRHLSLSSSPSTDLPPPPTYANVNKDRPPDYQSEYSQHSPPHNREQTSNKPGPKLQQSQHLVAGGTHGNDSGKPHYCCGDSTKNRLPTFQDSTPLAPSQDNLAVVPCVVEMNSCSSISSTPQSSPNHDPIASNGSSPSPSSSSTTDHDPAGQSGTESRHASNPNSRTESNGSLAEPGLKEVPPESRVNGHKPAASGVL